MKRSRTYAQPLPSKRLSCSPRPILSLLWLRCRLPAYQRLRLDLVRTVCEDLRPVVLFHFEQDRLVVWEWRRKELEVVFFGLKNGINGGKVCSIGHSLLHIGGYMETRAVQEIHFPTYSLNFIAPMLVPRHNPGVIVCNERVYVFGGHSSASFQRSCESLCLLSRTWQALPSMPHACSFAFSPCYYRNRIYLPAFSGNNEIDIFDLKSQQFLLETLPVPIRCVDSLAMIVDTELVLLDSFGRKVVWRLDTGQMRQEYCLKLAKKDAWLGYASVFQVGNGLYWMERDKAACWISEANRINRSINCLILCSTYLELAKCSVS